MLFQRNHAQGASPCSLVASEKDSRTCTRLTRSPRKLQDIQARAKSDSISASGPKQTWRRAPLMSAFRGQSGHPLGFDECLLMTQIGHRVSEFYGDARQSRLVKSSNLYDFHRDLWSSREHFFRDMRQ